jgi:hypothetical protein
VSTKLGTGVCHPVMFCFSVPGAGRRQLLTVHQSNSQQMLASNNCSLKCARTAPEVSNWRGSFANVRELHRHSFLIIVTVEYGNVGCFSVSSPLQTCIARSQVELCACVDVGIPRREVRYRAKIHSSRNISWRLPCCRHGQHAGQGFFPAAAAAAPPQRCTDSA